MRVGLVGFYGYNAYSDDLIAKAIKDAFNSRANIDWSILPLGGGSYSNLDLVVLGGGSLLGLRLPSLVAGLLETETPFIIFGPGFRNNESDPTTQYLWGRASLIGVRGNTSTDRLQKMGLDGGKIDFIGDPIFLLRERKLTSDGHIRGVIRPHMNVDSGSIRQFLDWLSVEREQPNSLLGFSTAQGDWHGSIGFDETYDQICRSSFWFGNRLHPFCVALVNGIPAMAVEVEFGKIGDVCNTIDYPYWVSPEEDWRGAYFRLMDDLDETMEKVKVNIDIVRRRLEGAVDKALELC